MVEEVCGKRKIRERSKRRRSEDIRSIVEKKMEYFYTEGIQKNERGDVKDDGNGIELLILLLRSTPMVSREEERQENMEK